MPVAIKNKTYYGTAEVCRTVGISRNTVYRCLREGVLSDVEYRDWHGWRLFTVAQVAIIRTKSTHIVAVSQNSQGAR